MVLCLQQYFVITDDDVLCSFIIHNTIANFIFLLLDGFGDMEMLLEWFGFITFYVHLLYILHLLI